MKVGLETVVSHFPETVLKRSDFSYLDPVTPEEAREIFKGPDEIRRLKDDNAVEILAERAVRKALDSAGLTTSDIDFIIAENIGGKYIIPMVGTYIHHKLGFNEETPVLNIQNVCAGFIDGCHIAWDLLLSGEYKRILVIVVTAIATKGVGADQTSPGANSFGDGAGAAIVSSQNLKCEFLSYHSRTFGELYEHMTVELRTPEHPELQEKAGVKATTMGNYLWAGPWFFEWQQRVGKGFALEGIDKALKKANLTLSDLDMVIPHQCGDFLLEWWMEGLEEAGVSRDKWKETWNKYGNVGNVDIAMNLAEFWEKGQIAKDSIIALFAPGLGGHTPCMIIKWLG